MGESRRGASRWGTLQEPGSPPRHFPPPGCRIGVGEFDETPPAGVPNGSGGEHKDAFSRPKPGEPTDVFRHRGAEQEGEVRRGASRPKTGGRRMLPAGVPNRSRGVRRGVSRPKPGASDAMLSARNTKRRFRNPEPPFFYRRAVRGSLRRVGDGFCGMKLAIERGVKPILIKRENNCIHHRTDGCDELCGRSGGTDPRIRVRGRYHDALRAGRG